VAREVKMSKEVKDAKIDSTETNMSTKENVIKSQPQTVSSVEKIDVISEDASNENNGDSENSTSSFADVLYDEITKVIGGNNSNQFFCMSLPGTQLNPKDYDYDLVKPAHVKANESKLANKMFDASFMSTSSNGKHLTTQYRTALNMLTPKMNGKLFEAKTKLREVLMTPYPYNFGDGKDDVLTLEQVFYRLYSDYIKAKERWSQKQIDKRTRIENKYQDNTEKSRMKINDEYLEWYGTVAEAEELAVEEKYGKVLSVFSPGDMEIITGILESGTGRELAEARSALENVGELDPNGGMVYPVTFYPQNWYKLLDTSFTPVDLLESQTSLSQQLYSLEMQKSNIDSNINRFLRIIPNVDDIENLKKQYKKCESAYKSAFGEYIEANENITSDMFKTIIDVIGSSTDKKAESLSSSTIQRVFKVGIDKVSSIVELLNSENVQKCIESQNTLVNCSEDAVQAAMDYFTDKNMLQMQAMLEPLQQQLVGINEKIEEQKQKIALSMAMQSSTSEESGKSVENFVAPNQISDRFTQVILTSSLSSLNNKSSKSSGSSESNTGAAFFFGGYSSNKSHIEAMDDEISSNSDIEIQIGMSVAKVEIDREWFNPEVFMLTRDMYNTSSKFISPKEAVDFSNKENIFAKMKQMNSCIFPCYPVSFIVAKDVTIRFTSANGISTSFAESVEDHSSKGGGFFIFAGSSSNVSSSSISSTSVNSTSDSVTIRFTAPQILGYYLQTVSPDESTKISDEIERNSDYISIFEFISTFKKMIDDHNSKYNKELMEA
jgi:hypothetical protein